MKFKEMKAQCEESGYTDGEHCRVQRLRTDGERTPCRWRDCPSYRAHKLNDLED